MGRGCQESDGIPILSWMQKMQIKLEIGLQECWIKKRVKELVKVFQNYKLDVCLLTESKLSRVDILLLEKGLLLLLTRQLDGLYHQSVGLFL